MPEIECPLCRAAVRRPDQPALISRDTVLTYGEFSRQVTATATALQADGVSQGDLVCLLADNCLSYPLLLHALWRLGAVACPISTRWPETSVAQLLSRIGCRLLVTTSDRMSDGYPTSVRQLEIDHHTLPGSSVGDVEQRPNMVDPDRAATVIFTSGTTTAPKAVLHSFGNHYYSAIGSNENIPVSPPDRWLLSLPLYHVGGLAIMFRMLLGGGTVVVGSGDDQIGESVERYQITHLSLVPTQLIRLLQEGLSPSATKRLKAVLIGGGPVRPELMVAAGDRGWPVFSTYGLTEMASQVTTSAPNDTQARSSTSGRLLSGRELIISPAGEILVRGKTLFAGYFNSKRVEKATDDEGWFHTGDTGALDCDGNLTVSGRLDNMFVSGGENIHPEEIETRLSGLQGVLQALVVPLADKEFGLRPTAILKLSSDTSLPVADITAHLEKHLPRFKIPVRLLQWPQSDGGGEMKPDRRRFRKLVQENAVADIT